MALPQASRTPAPPDPILGLSETFRNDTRPNKINLAVGVFVDETGTTPVLPTVIQAERNLLQRNATKTYRPIDGSPGYRTLVRNLLFEPGHEIVTSGRSATAQTPGGTGALRVAADFIVQAGGSRTIWLSEPTWPNHPQLFRLAGFDIRSYPYVDGSGRHIDREGLLGALAKAERGDVVLLHGSCHNPTGVDPTLELWGEIGDLVVERGLLPLVDFAYQGFGDGLREDADWLVGLVRPGMELLVASSFSKNFALYNERVGALTVVGAGPAEATAAMSHVKVAIRANYSNPPSHGADVVEMILGDPSMRQQWEIELAGMRGRIQSNRRALVEALTACGVPGDWSPIARQRGMFALLGLTADQVARLREDSAVYVVGRGRINVAGLTADNLPRFAEALRAVVAA